MIVKCTEIIRIVKTNEISQIFSANTLNFIMNLYLSFCGQLKTFFDLFEKKFYVVYSLKNEGTSMIEKMKS